MRTITWARLRSEEHTSELQSRRELVCRLLLEKKKEGKRQNRILEGRPASPKSMSSFVEPIPPSSRRDSSVNFSFFFFNDTATTEIYTLSLHDALPISALPLQEGRGGGAPAPLLDGGA